MILKRIYDSKLAQASYLIGCAATGECLVVDPNRDTGQYRRSAADDGLRVTHVTETHIHADFVSGARELAHQTGAALLLSDEGDADWKYAFAAEAGARLLHDGDTFMVGNLRIDVMHTPGHTPEHIVFLVTDTPASDNPIGVLTGDFVFVGDVGRPDLLEKAAKMEGTMDASARTLFRSLNKFKQLDDYIQIWPGHGAGSACGKSLGAVPQSTVGYERMVNWGLNIDDENTFVEQVLAGQPEPPKYFAEMKRINKAGPRILGDLPQPAELSPEAIGKLLEAHDLVVDTRPPAEFAAGHIPGTINIPFDKSFNTWAGSLLPYDRAFYLIAHAGRVGEAARDLAMIGLDRLAGYFAGSVFDEWTRRGNKLGVVAQISARQLSERLKAGEVQVLDVRGSSEWEAGHLAGVKNIPLGYLPERLADISRDRPVVVHCEAGGRSAIAASFLKANGFHNVINLTGGFGAWRSEKLPVEQ